MGLCRQLHFMALFLLQQLLKLQTNHLSKMLSARALQHHHTINKVFPKLQNQKGRSALHSLVVPILLVSLRNLGHFTAQITSPKASLSLLFKVKRLKRPERKLVEFYFKSSSFIFLISEPVVLFIEPVVKEKH